MEGRINEIIEIELGSRYTKDKRNAGQGDCRIGKNLKLSFDLYSMLFVTCFYPEYIHALYKKKQKKEEVLERLMDPDRTKKEDQ